MRKAKRRTLQLNAQLAQTLTEKGVKASSDETTTALVDKVAEISGGDDGYYDTFWDNFQQNGERTNYHQAFNRGWNNVNFMPKYDINVIHGESMFRDSGTIDIVEKLKVNNVVLDTSNAVNLNYGFYGSFATTIPTISVAKIYLATHLFYGCRDLHTIEKFIVHSEYSAGNAFSSCYMLKNITIEGEIGTTFDIKWSPLTVESAKSIITHLVNYAGTKNEFVYSVLFADSVWELLNAEGATAPDDITWEEYVNSIGWNK